MTPGRPTRSLIALIVVRASAPSATACPTTIAD
jgi:hypothetical protein